MRTTSIFYFLRRILSNIIIWLVALSIFNCSISTPDISGADFANYTDEEMDNWNEYESIYELVAEEVLNIEHAVPEVNSRSGNEHLILKKHAPLLAQIKIQRTVIEKHTTIMVSVPQPEADTMKPIAGYITLFSPPPDKATIA